MEEGKLEDADDADDVKATLIELIVGKMREEHGAGGADSAAELEAQKQEEKLQQLREELDAEECLEKCAVRQPVLSLSATESPDWFRVWAGNRAPESSGDRQQEMKRPMCFIRRSSRASP